LDGLHIVENHAIGAANAIHLAFLNKNDNSKIAIIHLAIFSVAIGTAGTETFSVIAVTVGIAN